jgi:hypothetical protein
MELKGHGPAGVFRVGQAVGKVEGQVDDTGFVVECLSIEGQCQGLPPAPWSSPLQQTSWGHPELGPRRQEHDDNVIWTTRGSNLNLVTPPAL